MFYGPKEILTVVEDGTHVIVKFTDETEERVSKKMFEAVQSLEPIDLTTLRERRVEPVVKIMLETLLEWDLKLPELDFLVSKVTQSINEHLEQASNKLWKKPVQERVLSDVDKVLKAS